MDRSLDPETADKMSRLITSVIPDILAFTPGNADMTLHVKTLFGVIQLGFPGLEPQVPSISEFFNFTEIKVEEADCSDDDLAEYRAYVQTAGVVGERTILEDYLIARKFQPVVQERYEIDLAMAQMIQLRVDLKQAKRFVGYTTYHALFGMTHRKADQIKTGTVDVNSILDDILLITEYHGPFNARTSGLNEAARNPFIHSVKLALTMMRDGFYQIMKAYQGDIYKMEIEEKLLAEKDSRSSWDPIFYKTLKGIRVDVAAQLEFIEALDIAIWSL